MAVNFIRALFLILLLIGGFEDKHHRRINNFLSASLILLGLMNIMGIDGEINYLNLVLSIITGLVVLYAIGVIGGGDFKIFLASSLIIEPQCLIFFIVLTILIGSIMVISGLDKKPPLVTVFALVTFPCLLTMSLG